MHFCCLQVIARAFRHCSILGLGCGKGGGNCFSDVAHFGSAGQSVPKRGLRGMRMRINLMAGGAFPNRRRNP